jgi:hypothetical protein
MIMNAHGIHTWRILRALIRRCSPASTAAREYGLRYPGRRHPDANVFRRLEWAASHKCNTNGTLNAGRPSTPANKYVIIAAVERETQKSSRHIARELDYPSRRSSKYFTTINCVRTTTRGAHICFQIIVLYACNFSNGYSVNILQMRSFYATFCVQTKNVLGVTVHSTSTIVFLGTG